MINDRERRIQILNDEYEQNKRIRQQICCDNDGFQIENDKLKEHINVLTKSKINRRIRKCIGAR